MEGGTIIEDIGYDHRRYYDYFGVDYRLETRFWNNVDAYSNVGTRVPELTLDRLDEHLGLITKPIQKETIMTNEITDMVNTAIVLEGLDKETVTAYVGLCEDYLGRSVIIKGNLQTMPYLALSEIGDGLVLYATNTLESSTKLVTVEKKTVYSIAPVERKTVTLFGSEYYEDMLVPMLSAMEDAKVPNVTPSAGGGTPPDKKIL